MRSVGEFGFARSSSFLSEAPAAKASCPTSTSPKSFQQRRANRSAKRAFQRNQNSSTGRSSVGRDDKPRSASESRCFCTPHAISPLR